MFGKYFLLSDGILLCGVVCCVDVNSHVSYSHPLGRKKGWFSCYTWRKGEAEFKALPRDAQMKNKYLG